MKKLAVILLALCLLLSGCNTWMDGAYHWKEPHQQMDEEMELSEIPVSNYSEMRQALEAMVEEAAEVGTLSVANYDRDRVESNLQLASRHIMGSFPLGAYAVEDIRFDIGTTGSGLAVAVNIQYNYNRSMIPKIRHVSSIAEAAELIHTAMDTFDQSLVMLVEHYETVDYVQLVKDHALESPFQVMETPQIIVNEYPENGSSRVVKVQFSYQTSRENLQFMQGYVQPVLASAALYVSGEEDTAKKLEQLYTLLMQRNEYSQQTSLTPCYSLLRYGVGDSQAVATAYAAMCHRTGMECIVVAGTKEGQAYYWNMVSKDGLWHHADLVASHAEGGFHLLGDEEMAGYVWDYSAYPAGSVNPLPEKVAVG